MGKVMKTQKSNRVITTQWGLSSHGGSWEDMEELPQVCTCITMWVLGRGKDLGKEFHVILISFRDFEHNREQELGAENEAEEETFLTNSNRARL